MSAHVNAPGSGQPRPAARPVLFGRDGVGRAVTSTAAVIALGGLLFGYDTGVVSGALLFLHTSFSTITTFQKELVTSLLLLGAVFGAFVAGRLADAIGRRPLILITSALFIIGVLGAAFAPWLGILMAMRFVIGVAVGSASMTVPLYIGEFAPPRFRGSLVTFNQLAITSGVLISFLVDYGLSSSQNWRLMFGLAAIPAVLLFIGAALHSESPHWLILRGREDEARRMLRQVRRADDDIEAEIDEVLNLPRDRGSYRELWRPEIRRLVMIGVTMAVLQQATGINTVIYYGPTFFKDAGFTSSQSILASVAHGAVNVVMVMVAIRLLDRVGRRPLLIGGTIGMAVSLATLATVFAITGGHLHGAEAAVGVTAQAAYTGSFAVGLGPVFWLMIAELYPLHVRGKAMSVATLTNWAMNFIVTLSFLSLIKALSTAGALFVYAGIAVGAVMFFALKVPETKGLSLQQIEETAKARSRSLRMARPNRDDAASASAPL